MAVVLVVDDEMGIRELLSEILEDEGHTVELAANAAQARAARLRMTPDLVLLDIWMPDTDGVTLLKEWAAAGQLTMPVVMMSGHGTIDHAVEATKIGATAFLEKPITLHKLLKAVEGALNRSVPAPSAPRPSGASPTQAGTGLVAQSVIGNSSGAYAYPLVAADVSQGNLPPQEPESSHTFELDMPLREARDSFERVYFEYHLARESGSMTRVAEKTGLERTHLYRKLKQLGVDIARGGKRGFAAHPVRNDEEPAASKSEFTPN
jgi:DNA-binding NtrC family response regulator